MSFKRFVFRAALCGVLGSATSLAAAAQYTIADLGTLGGTFSQGRRINDSGQVAGDSDLSSASHAFLYYGTLHDLGTLGGRYSFASDINNSGVIVGSARNDPEDFDRAYFYDGGMNELSALAPFYDDFYIYSFANAVNDHSVIVGTVGGSPRHGRGFIYDSGDGTAQDLSMFPSDINNQGVAVGATWDGGYRAAYFDGSLHYLPDGGGLESEAVAINDAGQIVVNGGDRAYLYHGSPHDLGTLGGVYSQGFGINATGQVVGQSTTANSAFHPFLYDGAMHDLGTLGTDPSAALAVNSAGVAVGYVGPAGYEDSLATLFDPVMGAIDLNTLIDPSSGWTLYRASAINDRGQIVGNGILGGQMHAFLLTPVPEPSTVLLAAAGGARLFATFVWRQRTASCDWNRRSPRFVIPIHTVLGVRS